MLIVAFVKFHPLSWVAQMVGLDTNNDDDRQAFFSACQWAPPGTKFIYRMQARAYIEDQFPRLASFLRAHSGDPTKLLSVAAEVIRLKHDPSLGYHNIHSASDRAEARRALRACRQTIASNTIAADIQRSTQRGAWNVCKA